MKTLSIDGMYDLSDLDFAVVNAGASDLLGPFDGTDAVVTGNSHSDSTGDQHTVIWNGGQFDWNNGHGDYNNTISVQNSVASLYFSEAGANGYFTYDDITPQGQFYGGNSNAVSIALVSESVQTPVPVMGGMSPFLLSSENFKFLSAVDIKTTSDVWYGSNTSATSDYHDKLVTTDHLIGFEYNPEGSIAFDIKTATTTVDDQHTENGVTTINDHQSNVVDSHVMMVDTHFLLH